MFRFTGLLFYLLWYLFIVINFILLEVNLNLFTYGFIFLFSFLIHLKPSDFNPDFSLFDSPAIPGPSVDTTRNSRNP